MPPSAKETIAALKKANAALQEQVDKAAATTVTTPAVPAEGAAAAGVASAAAASKPVVTAVGLPDGPGEAAANGAHAVVIAGLQARLAASEARVVAAQAAAGAAGPAPAPTLIADLDAARVAFCAAGSVTHAAYAGLHALDARMASHYGAAAAGELNALLSAAAVPGIPATAVLPALDALRAKMAQQPQVAPHTPRPSVRAVARGRCSPSGRRGTAARPPSPPERGGVGT